MFIKISNDEITTDDKIYCSCFSEAEPYRGLIVRRDYSTTGTEVNVVVGNNYGIKTPASDESESVIAIEKSHFYYRVYRDGVFIGSKR